MKIQLHEKQILQSSEALMKQGNYREAVRGLREGLEHVSSSAKHGEYKSSILHAQIAANEFHLYNTVSALAEISKVSSAVRDVNPLIDARCHSLYGLAMKREAYATWKSKDIGSAKSMCAEALNYFKLAESAAENAQDMLLVLNTRLNAIYVRGLISAIDDLSEVKNMELIEQTWEIVEQLPYYSPPHQRNDLTGITIMADLAYGAGLTSVNYTKMDFKNDFFVTNESNWQNLLIAKASSEYAGQPVHQLKALTLAAKFLIREGKHYLREQSLRVHNLECLLMSLSLDFEKLKQDELKDLANLTISKLADAIETPFKGRKVFR